MKIAKEQSESVSRRRTDSTMAKRKTSNLLRMMHFCNKLDQVCSKDGKTKITKMP